MNTLPTKWYIEVTEKNQEELNRWRKKVATEYRDHTISVGNTLLSMHSRDGSYYYTRDARAVRNIEEYKDYEEITIEQFRQITNSTQKPMTKSIQITRDILNQYYDAATPPQRAHLTEHFKLDGTTTDEAIRGLYEMACSTWKPRIKKNHPECFSEDSKYFDFSAYVSERGNYGIVDGDVAESLGINFDFIQVMHNPKNEKIHYRSFYLDSEYNWALIEDGGDTVLVPTKK